ncbi:MAG: GNAT family N-acetyltransferase [Kiloniellales bacterium]|nr:GNAT family N-acetyltransferase [Kiloniellales bacterium]
MTDDSQIVLRAARPGDAQTVADLMIEAGGGLFEFLLEGVLPEMTPAEVLALAIAGDEDPCSHRNVLVAEAEGRVVAMINAYPVDLLKADPRDLIPKDRLAHIAALDAVADWGSFFISSMAVAASHRRRGVARRLLARVLAAAERRGFDRVSLQVWADNAAARRLYESEGFTVAAKAQIAPHTRLPRAGESLLMVRKLSGAGIPAEGRA